jgi:thermostable 8-oxoguanine DNA glycosylase
LKTEKKKFHEVKEKEIVHLRDSIKDMENELKRLKEEAQQDRLLSNLNHVV